MINFIREFFLFLRFRKYVSFTETEKGKYLLQLKEDLNLEGKIPGYFDYKQNIKKDTPILITTKNLI